jgi:hypothetical protein
MPFLDANALETDPEGMDMLRAAIRPQPVSLSLVQGLPVQGLPVRAAEPADRGFAGALKTVRLHAERHLVRLRRLPGAVA